MYVVRNIGQFTYSKCKVASLVWFQRLGMMNDGGAQLVSYSYLVNQKHSI